MSNRARRFRGWRIAPLALLLLAGCGESRDAEADARQTIDQMKGALDAGPGARIEPGADAGPVTRLTAIIGNMVLADTSAYAAASTEAGMAQVIQLDGLTTGSPVLDHCERIDALGPRATALAGRYPAYLDAVRSEGGKLVAKGELPQAELDGMVHGMSAQQQAFHRQWTLAGELAGHAGKACRVLARRNWTSAAGGELRFTDQADQAEMAAVRSQMAPVVSELDRIGTAARAKSEEALQQLDKL